MSDDHLIRVVIPGVPVAQGRPRATVVGGHARVYSPKPAADWRGRAQVLMIDAADAAGAQEQGSAVGPGIPLRVEVDAYWPQPTSTPKRDRGRVAWRPSRPDGDNILKAVQDAGNGVLWHDDAQIVEASVRKFVAAYGAPPRVEIRVALADEAQRT